MWWHGAPHEDVWGEAMMHFFRKALSCACLLFMAGAGLACDDESVPNALDGGSSDMKAAGAFLAPCMTSSDCILGLCVDIAGQRRCSKPCGDEGACPALGGWGCEQSTCHCVVSAAFSTCATDRDCDGEADVAPTVESCNEVDDDCNGKIDDVEPGATGARAYFPDVDKDGYGDSNLTLWSCAPLEGYVERGGDCQDDDETINPDQVEICGDPHDNDCDSTLEDPDICGLPPLQVTNVLVDSAASLHQCATSEDVDPPFDIIEITGSQDMQFIRFVVRLEGAPATESCATYKVSFGGAPTTDAPEINALTYLYRPGFAHCTDGLAHIEAFDAHGALGSTAVQVRFNVGSGGAGSVSFIIPRTELLSHVPDPSYWIEACSIEQAEGSTDRSSCSTDRCAGPVHR
ncbi:MAG: putative metal-binding motif-containing protein [Deltaproteobacteria bacterium]|nr:putative metal-binding motif-containing protein [Deltaproteobacteria bacterium]